MTPDEIAVIAARHEQIVRGVGRDPNNALFVDVALSRELTDNELRDLHDYLREWEVTAYD